ncbi:MAG TPA: hypothetical protein V6D08_19925 [Candidatus Obscuribacterales bacterium]
MPKRTLDEALKEVLQDDNKVSKFEARVLRELIMADGQVSSEERQFLQRALENNQFDDDAFEMLSQVLLRAEMK